MIQQNQEYLKMEFDIEMNIMTTNQTLSTLSQRIFTVMETVLKSKPFDYIVVQGDTSTAALTSLVAFYNKLKIVHVEAGLRSGDAYSPFPEEVNRKIISIIASYHFAPTVHAGRNLKKEGITNNVYVTGNTIVDTLSIVKRTLPKSKKTNTVLITAHRRESFGEPMKNICKAIRRLAVANRQFEFVYPVHLNPNVREVAHSLLSNIPNVRLIEPLNYFDFVQLLKKAYLIISDSGGVQEEAPSFHTPVIVIRDVTERMELIKAKGGILVGTNENRIFTVANRLLNGKKIYQSMINIQNPFGDGKASKRIAKILLDNFNPGENH